MQGSGQSPSFVSKKEELEMLKAQADSLNEQISQIMNRIKELEKGKKEKDVSGMNKGFGGPHGRARIRPLRRGANIYVERRAIKAVPTKKSRAPGIGFVYKNINRVQPIPNVKVDLEKCTACGICEEYCPQGAIKIKNEAAKVDKEACIGCGVCIELCPVHAISLE